MIFEFKHYTDEELRNDKRFSTYLNYLKNIANLFKKEHFTKGEYLKRIIQTRAYKCIQRNKEADLNKIKALLRNAWFTEIQLNLSHDHHEFIPYTLQWACSQQYYSIHLLLRALFIAMKSNAKSTHAATLQAISEQITQRTDLFPYPLMVSCSGDPKNPSSVIYNNLPNGVTIGKTSGLKNTPNFWDSYCMFLRTTRERQIEDKRKDSYPNRKRITKKMREDIVNKLSPTTIFDCLFRLRVKANYQDVDPFLVAIDDKHAAVEFYSSITIINNIIMHVLELIILKYIGKENLEKIVNDFKNDVSHASQLFPRMEFLSAWYNK